MSNCKYFLGVTRMFMEKQLTNGESIIKLNSILKYINNDESLNSSFDRNLNGLSFEKLSEQTSEGMEQAYKSEGLEKLRFMISNGRMFSQNVNSGTSPTQQKFLQGK